MNREIEWFCFHAVSEKLISRDDCISIANAMGEAEIEPDLVTFAQVAVDNELCQNVERLEALLEMSTEEARLPTLPPFSVFEEDEEGEEEQEEAAAAVPEMDEEPAPAPPAAMPPPPKPTSTVIEAPGIEHVENIEAPGIEHAENPEWAQGWPDLSQAEQMPEDQARELMNAFLAKAREVGCSDAHVSSGALPFVRWNQNVYLLTDQAVLTPEAAEKLNLSLLNEEQRAIYDKTHDLDYSYAVSEEDRYRTNTMLQRLGVAGSYRVIDRKPRTLQELGFLKPETIEKLTTYHQGLILITGPAGCGKSTTLGALVDLINRTRRDHIITVEDPIEIVHPPKGCNITQREIGAHTRNFGNALRAALREDPDIIVIGELRDLETIEMAIRSSETGHLVIGTLHTGSASSTMDRVLDVFPPNQQAQIRAMAAESLKGVVCQQLLPNADGTGVCLATEIMLGTLAVGNLIREGDTYQLPSVIQTGRNIGMTTMEQSYFDLYMADVRSYEQTEPLIKREELLRQMQTREAQKAAEAAGQGKKKRWF